MRTLLIRSFTLPLMLAGLSLNPPLQQTAAASKSSEEPGLETVDHFVPHISTVPANEGEEVQLFLRERFFSKEKKNNDKDNDKCRRKGPVALFIHGATTSAVPDFDADFENYSWMSYLAENCFDVFAMDIQGYGLSTRPKMDDPCNASLADQERYLIPNPLEATCAPSYSLPVESLQSSYDEMDTVVDYIRELRKDKDLKINILGWSRGGTRAVGYAAHHRDKVEKLVLYSPGRIPPTPQTPRAIRVVLDRTTSFAFWDDQLDKKNCPNTLDRAIRDTLWDQILEFDELGSTWGPAGVNRGPGLDPLGWESTLPSMVTVPSLIIRGSLDTIADGPSVQRLYDDLGSTDKVLVTVSCATHALVWEKKHTVLLDASLQWLTSGTYHGAPVDVPSSSKTRVIRQMQTERQKG